MWGKEKESENPVSFSLSPEDIEFLKALRDEKDAEGKNLYCSKCQDNKSHTNHVLFSGTKKEWIEWQEDRVLISLEKGNYIECWSWVVDENANLVSLERIEAGFRFEPAFLSNLGTLQIEGIKNLGIGDIDHHTVSFSRENYDELPKDKMPVFQSPEVQEAVFKRQLSSFLT